MPRNVRLLIPDLPKKEWNFDSVPPDEIEACYFYEYGREYFRQSQTLQRLRARWETYQAWRKTHTHPLRAQWEAYQLWHYTHNQPSLPKCPPLPPLPLPKPPATPKKHETGLIANNYTREILSARHGFDAPVDFRMFPDVSWQGLPQRPEWESYVFESGIQEARDRQRKRKDGGDRFHIEALAELEAAGITNMPTWIYYHEQFHREQDLSNTEYGFFAINWDYRQPEIRRAFHEWLEEQANRRKVGPRVSPNTSRGQFKDKLRWLGALRVKNYYPYRVLVDYCHSSLEKTPYAHYPDLLEAAKKAKHLISELFPSEKEAAQIASRPLRSRPPLTAEDIAFLRRTAEEIRRGNSPNAC